MSTNLQDWERRVTEMQKCNRIADLLARHGEPHHKVQQSGFEIWHYPLGVASGMLYSVHVAVQPDQSCRAFMFMEPTDLSDSAAQRSQLRQSVKDGVGNAFRFLRTIVGG